MENSKQDSTNIISEENLQQPHLMFDCGRTTFLITLHFADKGKETLEDKIKRLIYKDVMNGSF